MPIVLIYHGYLQVRGCTGYAITDLQGLMGHQYHPHIHPKDFKDSERLRLMFR